MEFLPPEIDDYAGLFTAPSSPLLERIERETWQQVLMPRMCSGHQQGRFLSLISKLVGPRRILEVGTYTGYSALCMAEGLTPDGRLVTLDVNAELETRVRGYFADSPYAAQLDFRVGDARELIPQLDETWDLVFLDADKENYITYYEMVVDRVRPGGLILADNVLWSGKVADPSISDHETDALRAYNAHVAADPRVEHQLLPFRDGIMVARKLR
ncbi:MAG: O-methyltransferase [Bacteroidota bacterium]